MAKQKPYRITRLAAALLFGVGGCLLSVPQVACASGCGDLLQEKCQSCHTLARTCAGLGRDKESWQKTITKMAAYDTAITTKDQKALVKCLAKPEKDVADLCRP